MHGYAVFTNQFVHNSRLKTCPIYKSFPRSFTFSPDRIYGLLPGPFLLSYSFFNRATPYQRGICCHSVSVRPFVCTSVCNKSVFYKGG